MKRGECVCLSLAFICVCVSQSSAAIALGESFAKEVLHMPTLVDWGIGTCAIFLGYMFQYIATAGVFEYSHPEGAWSPAIPAGERKRRQLQIADELKLGWVAMATNVFFTLCWMRFIDPLVWTYGYFDTHQYTIWWFAGSILPYMFFFDTWFYWTHRWLHESDYLWDKVHRIHHGFKQPTAFAQDAAHPFEALLQGPAGHFMVTFFFPVHPVAHAVFGLLSSVFAIAAHDGRKWDLNAHYMHHDKGRGKKWNFNYSLYWPFWDWLCGTRWRDTDANLRMLKTASAPETWKADGSHTSISTNIAVGSSKKVK